MHLHKLFILFLFFSLNGFAQIINGIDTQQLSDEDLLVLHNKLVKDSILGKQVANLYIQRGREKNDSIMIARGFDRLSLVYLNHNDKRTLSYADSTLAYSQNSKHKTYPIPAYINKGLYYFRFSNNIKALDNITMVHRLAEKKDNTVQIILSSHLIIHVKLYWGNTREAVVLSKEFIDYLDTLDYAKKYKECSRKSYNVSIESHYDRYRLDKVMARSNLAESYIMLKEYDSAYTVIKEIFSILTANRDNIHFKRNKDEFYTELAGVIEYGKGNYSNAVDSLEQAIKLVNKDELKKHLYLGMAYNKLGKIHKGWKNILKADSIFEADNRSKIEYYTPILLDQLYTYYQSSNDKSKQLETLNKMIYVDSVLKQNYRYVDSKIKNTFETPQLLKQKERLINQLKEKQRYSTHLSLIILIVAVFACGIGLLYYLREQKYKRRFLELMQSQEKTKQVQTTVQVISIPENTVNEVLQKLSTFEINKEYLSPGISLQQLATTLGTNRKYLSSIINLHKGKRFTDYINDLRVHYAFDKLQKDACYQKYTIKAIAENCGFKTAESFSKAFFKRFGFYPSYFCKQLKKLENKSA